MSRHPIRAGIVGAGLMGRWHAWAAKKSGGTVAAIADPDPACRQRLAAAHPGAQTFADCGPMLAHVPLDVLHVCTPPGTHSQIAAAAIGAAVPVLIEKPLAPTAAETRELLELAGTRGVLIAPVHQFLFQDGVLRACRALARVGRIVRLAGTIHSAGGDGLEGSAVDGIVADTLAHPLSLMQLLLHTPLPQKGWVAVRPRFGELHALCDATGTALSISISMHARPTVCALDIIGTEATVHLNLYHGYAVLEPGGVSRSHKITQPFDAAARTLAAASWNLVRRALRAEPAYPGLLPLVRAFHDAVRFHGESPISAAATLDIARVRDQLIEDAGLVVSSPPPRAAGLA